MPDNKPIIPAVSVALVRGDRVLLVRRGRAPSRGLYAFPGGRVEPGETHEEAARRELFEETGLEAGALSPLALELIEGETVDYELQVFAGEYVGGEPQAASDAEAAAFFSEAEMLALPLTGSVQALALALLAGTAKIGE